jgi:outer membrane protein assembly factor BamB
MFESDMLLVGDVIYVGAIDGSVRALDAISLAERWKTQLRGIAVHGVALRGDTLYAALAFTGRSGPGVISGLDARTGAERMTLKVPNVSTAPAVDETELYFGTEIGPITAQSGTLYRVDLATQKMTPLLEGIPCVGRPVIDGADVLIASHDGSVRCVDRATGAERWQFMTRKFLGGTPSVADGRVLVGGFDHAIYSVDRQTGTEQWRFETGGPVRGTPIASGDTVFVASYDESVYALALSSGKRRWAYRTTSYVLTTPAVHDGFVIVGCNDGSVHAIDATSGKARWVWAGNDERHRGIIATPVIVDDRVIVASRTGDIVVLALKSGEPIVTPPPAAAAVPVAVQHAGGKVVIRDAGTVSLPSGRIVACDPFGEFYARPLARALKPGKYKVVVGTMEATGEVAFLALRASDAKAARWEAATTRGAKDDHVVVDSGTAAIMSVEAAKLLLEDPAVEERFGEAAEDQMNTSYGSGRAWAAIGVQSASTVDAVVCDSGGGDGNYKCHWGLDARGRPAALVIDFELVDDALNRVAS